MLTFLLLCLVARLAYTFNDIFVGRLARRYGRTEVAAFRGVSLGLSMAPWLLLVPASAWRSLGEHPGTLVATVGVTAVANLLQLQAVRLLPFGLRAALMISIMAAGSVLIGWALLGERLTPLEVGLCALLIGSAASVALGSHGAQEIEVDVPRGMLVTLLAALLMSGAVFGVKRLARETHPLLAAWVWEFGSGLILLVPVLLRGPRPRAGVTARVPTRFRQVALASLPTALASGASVLALDFGELGLWGALSGTQILFTAALGAAWHQETLGPRRWVCMALAAGAVAGLAVAHQGPSLG